MCALPAGSSATVEHEKFPVRVRAVAEPDETWFLASSDGGCVGEIDHERLVDRQTTLFIAFERGVDRSRPRMK